MEGAHRYRLVRTIGAGGMAQVYEGRAVGQGGIERRVAIKRLLNEHAADESVRRMFLDEARIASRIYHGNVVAVLDFGLLDGDEFLVMEHVDGPDAGRAARTGTSAGHPMPPGVCLHVISEIAHALAYVHGLTDDTGRSLAIVHRDLSPGNILLSWEGDVKLSDFGIALATGREERTATGVVKGKIAYMAPEQATGREIGPPADVFALGGTLHALLSGAPPKTDDELPWWLDPARDRAPPLAPGIDQDVAALLRDMLVTDPEARVSAADVASRASKLAAGRLGRSGREALVAYLAPLRPKLDANRALDELFGVMLVPSAVGSPRFEVVREGSPAKELTAPTLAAPLGPAPRPAPGSISPPDAEPERSAPTPSRAPLVGLGALALVALVAAAVSFTRASSEPSPTPTPPSAPSPPRLAPEGPPLTPTASDVPPAASDPDAGPEPARLAELAPAPSQAERIEPRPRHVERPAAPATERRVEPPRASEPASPAARGWVRIGGAALADARVEIDGRYVGHVPTLQEVALGARHVVVRNDAGEVLLDREVAVAVEHTQLRPAVVR